VDRLGPEWPRSSRALLGREELAQVVRDGFWVCQRAQMSDTIDLDDVALRYVLVHETDRLLEVVATSGTLDEGERSADPRERATINGTIQFGKLLHR
jgi:hypothetical protein